MFGKLAELLNVANWEIAGADVGVLAGYFVLMLVVGYICRNLSSDISDYIRMGCKGTWWLAGLSVFMQSFSAATFTGYCGQAFLAGWSVMLIFWGNALMFFIQAAFFAPWLRQTRAITPADAVRQRFGPVVEQVFLYFGIPGGLCWSGMFLLTLATFLSAMFGLPLVPTMVVVAAVIIVYSVSGGSWSVQITDTLQSFILVPVTIAIAALCLIQLADGGGLLDGIRNMMGMITERGLSSDYQLIKPANYVYPAHIGKSIGKGYFTMMWLAASVFNMFLTSANMTTCYRYLSIKNGNEARKAAILAGVLMIVGSFIWFIPPVAGRLLYEDEILALGRDQQVEQAAAAAAGQGAVVEQAKPQRRAKLSSASDGAYAVVAKKVLPPGMLGLVLIAMASAAMSSMDSNLTGTAGLLTNNVYPPLARRFGATPMTGKRLLVLTKFVNLCLGVWALFMAFVFYHHSGSEGIFSLMLKIFAFVGAPIGMPMVVSFFARRLPSWGPLVGMSCGWIMSGLFMLKKKLGIPLPDEWHYIIFIQAGVTIIPTLLTRVFWSTASQEYRAQVDRFFKQFHTPIDYAKEVGKDESHSQMQMVGRLATIMGVALTFLVFFGNTTAQRLAALFVSGSVTAIGLLLFLGGMAKERKSREAEEASGQTS